MLKISPKSTFFVLTGFNLLLGLIMYSYCCVYVLLLLIMYFLLMMYYYY